MHDLIPAIGVKMENSGSFGAGAWKFPRFLMLKSPAEPLFMRESQHPNSNQGMMHTNRARHIPGESRLPIWGSTVWSFASLLTGLEELASRDQSPNLQQILPLAKLAPEAPALDDIE